MGLLVDVRSSSSARCFQPLPAVAGLGLMLSTTAEIMAPAAFTPCIRACSTCKADQFAGSSVRTLGLHPGLPRPHHSPSGTGLPGGFSQSRKQPVLLISKDPRAARDQEKPGLPRTAQDGHPRKAHSLSLGGERGTGLLVSFLPQSHAA